MAFNTEANSTSATLTGANQTIPVAFPFFESSNLVVRRLDVGAAATTLLAEGNDYAVTGGNGAGGSVTMKGGTAGQKIFVRRSLLAHQVETFQGTGVLDTVALERGLDRLACLVADLKAMQGRFVRLSAESVEVDEVELLAGAVAGKLAGFAANGSFGALSASEAVALLNLPETVVDRPQKTFGNAAARAAAVPDFVGQVGIQLDKVSDGMAGGVWLATATTAGAWAGLTVSLAALADGLVTSAKLGNGSVTAAKLAAGAVGSAALAAGAVGASALANGAVVAAKIGAGEVGANQLATGAVNSAKLAAGAVGTAALANGSVTGDKLAAGSVVADKLGDGQVTAPKLAAGAVETAALKTGAVTSEKIANGAIGNQHLATEVVWKAWDKHFRLELQAVSGTGGGDFTAGAWRVRGPFTEVIDDDSFVSLSGNQFILQPGTYLLQASAAAYRVNNHRTRLYNVTAGAQVALGENTKAVDLSGSSIANGIQSWSPLSARVTLSVATTFELQHQCETTFASNGMGRPAGWGVELFAWVQGWRLA